MPSEQRVRKVVLKKVALTATRMVTWNTVDGNDEPVDGWMEEMFHHCSEVCKEYAKTFYLGKREKYIFVFTLL
jgi:15-cis-phytoene synthase